MYGTRHFGHSSISKILFLIVTALILSSLIFPKSAVAEEIIGRIIAKNNNQITIKVYKSSTNQFSFAEFFGISQNQPKTGEILNVKINSSSKPVNLSVGNIVKLSGKFIQGKLFTVKKIQTLPADPTGVRARLGIMRHRRKNFGTHRTQRQRHINIHRPMMGNRHGHRR